MKKVVGVPCGKEATARRSKLPGRGKKDYSPTVGLSIAPRPGDSRKTFNSYWGKGRPVIGCETCTGKRGCQKENSIVCAQPGSGLKGGRT